MKGLAEALGPFLGRFARGIFMVQNDHHSKEIHKSQFRPHGHLEDVAL